MRKRVRKKIHICRTDDQNDLFFSSEKKALKYIKNHNDELYKEWLEDEGLEDTVEAYECFEKYNRANIARYAYDYLM